MPSLAEFQSRVRDVLVGGYAGKLAPSLFGGDFPERRLAIHSRHYHASLSRALIEKFPALNWLVGTPMLVEAVRGYIRRHPPRAPCIAEYGEDFPAFLAAYPGARDMPWVRHLGDLEWHVGHAVLAIGRVPLAVESLSEYASDRILALKLDLQPGLRYLAADWPVDELLRLFLSETAPERYELSARNVYLEIHGVRGVFDINRLGKGTFSFRRSIAVGRTIGDAAADAMEADPSFDPGSAFAAMLAAGLVIALRSGSAR